MATFFEANQDASLAEAMLRVITNRELRERQVRDALVFVQDYSWEKNQSLYLDAVSKLLQRTQVRPTETESTQVTPTESEPTQVRATEAKQVELTTSSRLGG